MENNNKPMEEIKTKKEAELSRQLFSFYQHHLEQFDRLIRMVEILKQENQLLRNMINKTVQDTDKLQSLPHPHYTKPRVTCWPINKLEE